MPKGRAGCQAWALALLVLPLLLSAAAALALDSGGSAAATARDHPLASARRLAAVTSLEQAYREIAASVTDGQAVVDGQAATNGAPAAEQQAVVDGQAAELLPAPAPEVFGAVPSIEAIVVQAPPASPQPKEPSVGSKVGDAAKEVGQGMAEAGQGIADVATTVADAAGDAVASALDTVADALRGRRLLAKDAPLPLPDTLLPPASTGAQQDGHPPLPHGSRALLLQTAQARDPASGAAPFSYQPESLDSSGPQAGPDMILDISSPLPFIAALLQPALEPVLPAVGEEPEAATDRQQLLDELAVQLAPIVEQVLNDTQAEISALVDEVSVLLPEDATAAEAAAFLENPEMLGRLAEPLNATVEALASALNGAAEEAGEIVYAHLATSAPPGSPPLGPLPAFLDRFVAAFVPGFTQGVLDALFGTGLGTFPTTTSPGAGAAGRRRMLTTTTEALAVASPNSDLLLSDGQQPHAAETVAAAVAGAALRRRLLQAGTGIFYAGTVVQCAGEDECTGYHVEAVPGAPPSVYIIPAAEAAQLAGGSLEGRAPQAATVGGSVLEAGVLAGAASAASEVLQAAGAALAAAGAQLVPVAPPPAGGRKMLLQVVTAPSPEPEATVAGEGTQSPGGSVQAAIAAGTQEAAEGVQTATDVTSSAVQGTAGVAGTVVDAATNVTLGVVQSGAELVQGVQQLVDVVRAVGGVVGG